MGFFTGSGRNIFFGIRQKNSTLTDKRFLQYGHSKRPKMGTFVIFGVKIETHISEHLWWDFFTGSGRNIFWGDHTKNFSPNGQAVFKLGPFLAAKKGCFCRFLGENWNSTFWPSLVVFFTGSERTILLGSQNFFFQKSALFSTAAVPIYLYNIYLLHGLDVSHPDLAFTQFLQATAVCLRDLYMNADSVATGTTVWTVDFGTAIFWAVVIGSEPLLCDADSGSVPVWK